MKFIIKRTFALRKKKFEIISNGKELCQVKASVSKDDQRRYSVKSSMDESFLIELDPNDSRGYLIYLKNRNILFGRMLFQLHGRDNYLYHIIIGEKIYQVRSSDLIDRRLTIIDQFEKENSSGINCPEVLVQTNNSFSQSNRQFHLTINHLECQYGYLALVILLILHEDKQMM